MFSKGVPVPFLLSTCIPRKPLTLDQNGNDSLIDLNIHESLIMVNECGSNGEDIDNFLNLINIEKVGTYIASRFPTRVFSYFKLCIG